MTHAGWTSREMLDRYGAAGAAQAWARGEPLDHDEFVVVPYHVVSTVSPTPA